MFIYYFLIVVLGSNPILFTSLYLGCPPCGNLVHYVGIFNVFIAGSSPKGDMFFLTLLFLQSRRLDIETHLLIRLPFLPFRFLASS